MNAFIFASAIMKEPFDSGVFKGGANAFQKIHDVSQDICWFNWQNNNRAYQHVKSELQTISSSDPDGLDAVVYFGHGTEHGLTSVHIYDKVADQVREFAQAILSVSKPDVKVILYACRAGVLGGSIAQNLSLALAGSEAVVFAHEHVVGNEAQHGAGHSFANFYVTRWEKGKGRFVIQPETRLFPAWRRLMKEAKSHGSNELTALAHPFWAKFPFMTQKELEDSLEKRQADRSFCTQASGHHGHQAHSKR